MWRLEDDTDVEKVETVFCEVGKSLSFIPFIAHSYYVHNLCLHVKGGYLSRSPSSLRRCRLFKQS